MRILLAIAMLCCAVAAHAETRVAFVLANSAYENAPRLENPARDARIVADTLQALGFQVTIREDLTREDFSEALGEFLEKSRDADVTFFYYAGHGMQYDGRNYLVGTDAELRSEFDIDGETIALDRVVEVLERNSKATLVFVDACRDNPLASNFYRRNFSDTRALETRGLARVRAALEGTMLVFAAAPGQVAYDGTGENSPFAEAVARHLPTEGKEILTLTKRIIGDVREATGGRQSPIVTNDLTREIYLREAAMVAPSADLAKAFAEADRIGTLTAWTNFLEDHGDRRDHPLYPLAEARRTALLSNGPKPTWGDSVDSEAAQIAAELRAFAAAEKLASPRGWALFFDRFPVGRLSISAHEREARVVRDDLAGRVFGRYRSARDGETMTPAMIDMALETLKLTDQMVREMQWSLNSRGNNVGEIDGSIGPRTRQAISNFQRARDLPVTGIPNRATLAALGINNTSRPMANLYPTSGAMSKAIDAEAAAVLEQDKRLDRLLKVVGRRPLVYGYHGGRLYAAIYLGTTYGEGAMTDLLEKSGAQLAEIGSAEEQDFILELVRYDQKLWGSKGDRINPDDGPTIGLALDRSTWGWRSGNALSYQNWAPGEPGKMSAQTALNRAYGRLVPTNPLPRNATRVERSGWATGMQISPTVIVEIP